MCCQRHIISFHFIPFDFVFFFPLPNMIEQLLLVGCWNSADTNIGTLLNCCLTILIWYAKKTGSRTLYKSLTHQSTHIYVWMCYVHRWQIRGTNHITMWTIFLHSFPSGASQCRRSSSMCWTFCKFHFLFFVVVRNCLIRSSWSFCFSILWKWNAVTLCAS